MLNLWLRMLLFGTNIDIWVATDFCQTIYSKTMKTIQLTVLLLIATVVSVSAQRVGEKIEIESSGTWYAGSIKKIEGGKYFVSYADYGESWDEWVEKDRIKLLAQPAAPAATGKYQVGDRVEVEYGMVPEPATVIEVGENKYHIKYDNTLFKTKWVLEGQMKKL